MTRRPVLCPRCRHLVGSEETVCSWCGTARSASWWRLLNWSRGSGGDGRAAMVIITANVLFFALSLLLSSRVDRISGFLSPGQVSLMLLGATGTYPIDHLGRFWTLLSANYLHAGLLHLLFNLMALKQLAPWVEREYGTSRMISIYTLGGVAGYLVSYGAGVPFTVGASAAVCSLIGSLLYYGKSRGGVYGGSLYREVSGWVISLFVFGLIFPGINNWAHGGGIVGGIVLGALLGYNERRSPGGFDRTLALFCVLATAGTLAWAVVGGVVGGGVGGHP